MTDRQPEALRLADLIDANLAGAGDAEISAELRRLHAENADFRATTDHLTRENAEQIGETVALKEKLDDLLVALRIAVAAQAAVCNVKWVARHCRSAIAKAEGEKS